MKRFVVPAGLVMLFLIAACRVGAQDDQYLRVYSLIQEADHLKSTDQPAPALAHYLEAQAALARFQRVYPDWNPAVVNYRLNYVAARIAELSARVPAVSLAAGGVSAAPTSGGPPMAAATAELANQLNALQEQVRQLQNEKTVLDAKLKEALSAQPASVDPRELGKSQDQIKSLRKENELLKVNLAQQRARTASVDPAALEQLKRDLADAGRRLAVQTETAAKLELEKTALQEKMNSLIPAGWNETNIVATRRALAEANRKLAEQTDANVALARERDGLQARVTTLTADAQAAAALRTENEILKKQLAELKNPLSGDARDLTLQLAAAKAQVAALQSDMEILRLEKEALQQRLKQTSGTAAAGPPVADSTRVKELERERDELQTKLSDARNELGAAQKEQAGRSDQALTARVAELTGQLEVLRNRLSVLEAQQVPYTTEELAMFKRTETALPDTQVAKRTVRELPPGAVTLEAEARRDFAARRLDQAEQKYLQVLRQDENNVYTLANLAVVQLEMNHFDAAETNINKALALAPEDAYSLSLLGFLRFRQGKYDEALDVLGRAAKLDPQNPEIQNYLGLTLSQKGMRIPAETSLRKAVELDPNYAKAHYNLAVIYITQKPPATEMARLHYKKAITGGVARNADLEKMLGITGATENR